MTTTAAAFVATLPFDNRVETGSIDITPAELPKAALLANVDADRVAADVVAAVNRFLNAGDYAGISALFAEAGAWRDHLGLSWDLRTLQGPKSVALFLADHGAHLQNIAVDESAANRTPVATSIDPDGTAPCVQLFLTFTSVVGRGRGLARVIPAAGGWKFMTLYTVLTELTGSEEPLGDHRPLGASHGGGRNLKNWAEQRAEQQDFAQSDPAVLVIGAGQGGLTAAARLRMLGVSSLVVDREQRVGDNWRQRYRQLVLHDPVWYDHMPYLNFPAWWPVFTPKDKLADFFEAYVRLLELNVWTRTEIRSLTYDAAARHYTVTLERQRVADDGSLTTEERTFRPRHIVQATGHSGKKNMPDVPGLDTFAGPLWHSSDFPGATPPSLEPAAPKRRAVVVGACNSAHDIAQDLWENGYEVTMVQRSSTCVVSSRTMVDVSLGSLYSEHAQRKIPVEDADLLLWSLPATVAKAVQIQGARLAAEADAPLLQALQAAGFALDRGPHGAGLLAKYYQRGGGYYIDVGASQLIVDGHIRVRSGQGVAAIEPAGVRLADGSLLPADALVFATGYQNMRSQTRLLFGDKLADQCGDVWGFDTEGEFRTMWRRSGQPGFWFMGGNLAISRHFSRVLALQIKAQEAGIAPYL